MYRVPNTCCSFYSSAVRHGRYTVAIRTKTILEVKQLERENAIKRLSTSDGESVSSGGSPEASVSYPPIDQSFSPIEFETFQPDFQTNFDSDFLIDSPGSMTPDELLQSLDSSDGK